MRSSIKIAAAVAAALGAASGAAFAAPSTSINAPVHAFFGKPHKVSLTLHNDSKQAVTLKAGEQELTLKPGEDATIKLIEGD